MASARRRYTKIGLMSGHAVSRKWLTRDNNFYLPEITASGAAIGHPGATLLHISYERACVSGTNPAPGGAQMLVRVLDWDLDGLGRDLHRLKRYVTRMQ